MTLPRLRAPADDGGVLAVPPLDAIGETLAVNRSKLQQLDYDRRFGAAEAIAQAVGYHRECDQSVPTLVSKRLVVAGHQPELFHPGVWLKNFALGMLARGHERTALNFIVDNDTLKSPSIRVPFGVGASGPSEVRLSSLAFDAPSREMPFEERRISDRATFESFGDRLAEATRDWPFVPLGVRFWPKVVDQAARTDNLGKCLAAARRGVEREWGVTNLELPTSRLARMASFHEFVASILNDLPRFHATYNACVADYRRLHRIRSKNHPVPDLGRDGDWLETPFWGWRTGAERRGRLFARPAGDRLELRTNGRPWPAAVAKDRIADGLAPLEGQGLKLRPRALTLTMFARLYLAELFVHGIGGGKYDELTDAIIARFFRVTPPVYAVVTGTLRLPLAGFQATEADVCRLHRLVRDLSWNPQRHVPASDVVARRLALQNEAPVEHAAKVARLVRLRALADELAPAVAPKLAEAERGLARAKNEVAANAVSRRRDYSFVLFPEERLRRFLTQSEPRTQAAQRPE